MAQQVVIRPATTRMPVTGGILNGSNQPVVTTAPAIRAPNTRKGT